METNNLRFGQVRAFDADEVAETRTIDFNISDESKDRHGTVLDLKGWDLDPFNRNGVVGYQHNLYGDMCNPPEPEDVIAKGNVFAEGRNLVGRTTFAPKDVNEKAERVFRMVLTGFLNSTSVGFNPLEDGTFGEGEEARGAANETYYFGKRELLEYSIVNIPSNRNAQVRQMRENSASALMYLRRELDYKYSLAQIERFTIAQALDALDGKDLEIRETDPEKVREMLNKITHLQQRNAMLERQLTFEKLNK